MKIAILSDIHGNLHALEAVLRHARGQEAAQIIINLGDSVGYGPNPEEVIRRISGKGFVNVLGDYDQKVLSKQHRHDEWKSVKIPDKRAMFAWTYEALSKRSKEFLKALPKQRTLEFKSQRLILSHGSPESIKEHLGPDTPKNRLQELAKDFQANVILCGNSHRAFIRRVSDVLFVNPGSVGRPDDGDPRASYAVLEIKEGQPSAHTFRVPYNINGAVRAMRQTELPQIFTDVIRRGRNYNDIRDNIEQTPQGQPLEPCGTLTLLTDFGLKDHFIGVMKGVISDIAPQTRIIDISHQIRPQNVIQAARMLLEAAPYFTPGTVHVAVVDPGVGTARRAIAARVEQQFFVVPDNGLLWPILQKAKSEGKEILIVDLDKPEYWLPNPSASFHGRDIFSPAGAHLVNGLPLEILGSKIDNPVQLNLPEPKEIPEGLLGEVAMVDVFGNLNTNILAEAIPPGKRVVSVDIAKTKINGLTHTFGDAKPGTLIATIDSTGFLAISVTNGNAAQRLDADMGTPVKVILDD